jgi:hypothetical protein
LRKKQIEKPGGKWRQKVTMILPQFVALAPERLPQFAAVCRQPLPPFAGICRSARPG